MKDAFAETSIFDFTVLDIDKKEVSLKEFAGKVCLIVNVASECALTSSSDILFFCFNYY